MDPQTIKFSFIEFPAINIYVHAISILIIIFLIKIILGKQIVALLNKASEMLKDRFDRISHEDWLAHCRKRKEWPQKQDVLSLDLKGRYLKSLTFVVTLTGRPECWRAGFVLGNERLTANEIVDTKNGITIHTGSGYEKKEGILPVWKYYDNFDRANPDFSSVKSENTGWRVFQIKISKDNFMQAKIQNDLIFAQRISPSFRRRIYLKAWADNYPDIKIKFRNIKYSLWS